MVREDRMIYESIDSLGQSRNWEIKDIKELKLENPYELVVEPFRGGKYSLHLEGQGMEPEVFKAQADRVTSARIAR